MIDFKKLAKAVAIVMGTALFVCAVTAIFLTILSVFGTKAYLGFCLVAGVVGATAAVYSVLK